MLITCYNNNIWGLNKIYYFLSVYFYFLNAATRTFKITYVSHIIFLLDRVAIENTSNPKERGMVNGCGGRENRGLIIIKSSDPETASWNSYSISFQFCLYVPPLKAGQGESYCTQFCNLLLYNHHKHLCIH